MQILKEKHFDIEYDSYYLLETINELVTRWSGIKTITFNESEYKTFGTSKY